MASFELGSVAEPLPPAELFVSTPDVLLVPSAELMVDEDVAALAKCNCELVGVDGWDANRGNALASNNDPEPDAPPVLLAASGGNLAPLEPMVVVGVPE